MRREAAEDDVLQRTASMGVAPFEHRRDGDVRGRLDGIAVDASADARERDRPRALSGGQIERAAIARRELARFAVAAAAPDGADRVGDEACTEPIARGELHV